MVKVKKSDQAKKQEKRLNIVAGKLLRKIKEHAYYLNYELSDDDIIEAGDRLEGHKCKGFSKISDSAGFVFEDYLHIMEFLELVATRVDEGLFEYIMSDYSFRKHLGKREIKERDIADAIYSSTPFVLYPNRILSAIGRIVVEEIGIWLHRTQ